MFGTLPRWGFGACVCVFAAMAASGARADALDPPTVSYVSSGRGTIRLMVVPGPSGAPGGFTLEWIPAATLDALGDWPDPSDPRIQHGGFVGKPTLNTTDGTTQFRMTSVEDAGVQLGDMFDETGIATAATDELDENTSYVVRARANTYGGLSASDYSVTVVTSTSSGAGHDCTYTQGFWKNHSSVWPVGSVKLGTVTYNKTQLLSIFNRPAAGNGLISLVHQLIATKLNIANGASVPPAVATAISQADALIGGLVVPPVGSGFLDPSSTSGLTETLDQYNNGELGPDHCSSVTAAGGTSWGRLKATYR